jgi:hypothetical protein
MIKSERKDHLGEREKGGGELVSVLVWEDDGGATLSVGRQRPDPVQPCSEERHYDSVQEARAAEVALVKELNHECTAACRDWVPVE